MRPTEDSAGKITSSIIFLEHRTNIDRNRTAKLESAANGLVERGPGLGSAPEDWQFLIARSTQSATVGRCRCQIAQKLLPVTPTLIAKLLPECPTRNTSSGLIWGRRAGAKGGRGLPTSEEPGEESTRNPCVCGG